ncbi:fungal-specific transcription factor domain-containing protein [Trichoderma novae-zelandiae]
MELCVPTAKRRESVDCFNCSASQRSCDRTKHRCDTCERSSELCQGYPRALQWLTGVTSRGKQKGRSISIDASNSAWESTTPTNHTFIFKQGRPPRKGRLESRAQKQQWKPKPTPTTPRDRRESNGRAASDQPTVPAESQPHNGMAVQDDAEFDHFAALGAALDGTDTHGHQILPYGQAISPAVTLALGPCNLTCEETTESIADNSLLFPLIEAYSKAYSPPLSFQPAIGSSELLAFYDAELCTLPLTFDFSANPFRCNTDPSERPQYLFHALLAFSIQHVSRLGDATCEDLSDQQIASYRYSANNQSTVELIFAGECTKHFVVDTILVLFALDTLTSAAGPWYTRLHDAYQKLETLGGVNAVASSSRFQAQIAMFVWWDCSISLLSRSHPVFPSSYYDFVLSCDDPTWNIFIISGVPRQLFQYLRELLQLACEKEQISGLRYATFDMSRVRELERYIQEYSDDGCEMYGACADEETVQNAYDYHHASNTWKYALLLYICRVFKWDRTRDAPMAQVSSLSRQVLDSARCCRPESNLQKQFLIPIFLAGAEATGAYSRKFAKDYCEGWYRRSRYCMFTEAVDVLEEIWSQRDAQNNAFSIWWGSLIEPRKPNASEFLFG